MNKYIDHNRNDEQLTVKPGRCDKYGRPLDSMSDAELTEINVSKVATPEPQPPTKEQLKQMVKADCDNHILNTLGWEVGRQLSIEAGIYPAELKPYKDDAIADAAEYADQLKAAIDAAPSVEDTDDGEGGTINGAQTIYNEAVWPASTTYDQAKELI